MEAAHVQTKPPSPAATPWYRQVNSDQWRAFWDRRPVAIDIYNNYITNAHDNSIEMDGSMHNIRVMRNVLSAI